MTQQKTEPLTGVILEDEIRLTLRELCDTCMVQAGFVIDLVNEGVIEPSGVEKSHWCFTGFSVRRIKTAKHLQRDLDINLAGIALALDLIEEVEQLQTQLNRLSVSDNE